MYASRSVKLRRRIKRYLHHRGEGILSFLSRRHFSREDMVGDCAECESVLSEPCRVHVECRRFHFYRHDAHFRPFFGSVRVVVVECV